MKKQMKKQEAIKILYAFLERRRGFEVGSYFCEPVAEALQTLLDEVTRC